MDFEGLKEQIKYNCNVSDAKFWGYYSICGLLLRMRELYRSEKGMEFYETIAMEEISPWIGERDVLWNEMEKAELRNIEIGRNSFSPFDVDDINNILADKYFIYGAGFGRHMKPNFFLAQMIDEVRSEDHYDMYIVGKEYVRDIDTVPAMVQGRDIFVRKQRVKGLLWEKYFEMRSKKYAGLLDYAFRHFDIERTEEPLKDIDERIDAAVEKVTEMIILHEIGEVMEDRDVNGWLELLGTFNGTKEEFILRAVKDVLADCSDHGPLQALIKNRDEGMLGFYAALLTGLHKIVFPEMMNALQEFVENKNWDSIDVIRAEGYARFLRYRETIMDAWSAPDGKEKVKDILGELN
jgi:hypothetical protein